VSLKAGFDVNNIDPDTVVCFSAYPTKFNTTGNNTMILKFKRGTWWESRWGTRWSSGSPDAITTAHTGRDTTT